MNRVINVSVFSFLLLFLYASAVGADKKQIPEEKKAIEIKGQTRNFNMTLILKTKKDKISFVKTRTDYRKEILSTEP